MSNKALRENDAQLLDAYEQVFSGADLAIVEIDAAVIDWAAEIRARFGFKTPDAIHLASAGIAGAARFLTADKQMTRYTKLRIEVL